MLRRARTKALTIGTVLAAAVLPVVLVFAAPASASTLTNGPVGLTTQGSVTGGTPYSSGQNITVAVSANSTFVGLSEVQIIECSDYDGTTANLPTTPANNCDGNTEVEDSTTVNSSTGAVGATTFTIYALPDSPTFGESSGSLPKCGLYPYDCVLFIGQSSTAFTADPYLFSAPFQVAANGSDSGASPGDGTPEVPLAIGLPLLAVAIGGGTLFLRRRRARTA